MGVAFQNISCNTRKKSNRKMAFYMIKQPMFNLEPMTACGIRRRNLMKEFLAEAFENYCDETDSDENDNEVCMIADDVQDKQLKIKSNSESRNENDESKELIEAKNDIEIRKVKRIMNKVEVNEDLQKLEIKIELIGYNFQGDDLDVRVIDNSSLEILANGNDMKYQKQFKLPSNAIIEKIKSKFGAKENDHQTLTIRIPKDVKVFQVPISMEE